MTAPVYAVCEDCKADLFSEADVVAHHEQTMAPVKHVIGGVTARSHSTRRVHFSPDELERHRVSSDVDSLVDRLLDGLYDLVDQGHATEQQIGVALSSYDLADAWADYCKDAA